MTTINPSVSAPTTILPDASSPSADDTNGNVTDLNNNTATDSSNTQFASAAKSLADISADFHPEQYVQKNGGNEIALNDTKPTNSVSSDVPNQTKGAQLMAPSDTSTGTSSWKFQGGAIGKNVVDPDPNGKKLDAQAERGIGSTTSFKDIKGNTIHVVRTPAPYYLDKNGAQKLLQPGQSAPKDAQYAYYHAYEKTSVRELKGDELGLLKNIKGPNDPKLKLLLDKVERNNEAGILDATKGKFKTLDEARAYSKKEGYFGSGPHIAAANAASARTGGKIPAEWFMKQDAFMGRAGSNQLYFPSEKVGLYPGTTSQIGVAHDADYGLGANFHAGPLKDLYERKGLTGTEGLSNFDGTDTADWKSGFGIPQAMINAVNPPEKPQHYDSYGTGHKDWQVNNEKGHETRVAAKTVFGVGLPADPNSPINQAGKLFNAAGEGMSAGKGSILGY